MMPDILTAFREQLIPWAQQGLQRQLVVARPKMNAAEMPPGVELSQKKIGGKRVLVRTRNDGPQKIVHARWPEDGLHETYSSKLICVLKGRTDYRAGNYVISCGAGKFILQPPFVPNTIGGRSHLEGENRQWGSCDLLQLILARDHIICGICSSRGETHQDGERRIVSDSLAISLFRLFVEEAQREFSDEVLITHSLTTFSLLALREMTQSTSTQSQLTSKSTFSDDLLQQIHHYIKANLSQSLTIEKVAQAMYMSPSQFTRYLRQKTDKSFVEILTEHRLEEAKRLLRETEWSVTAISMQMGFKSAPYFTLFFTKNVGISPSAYRDNKND